MQNIRGCGRQAMTATLMGTERLTTCPRYFIKKHTGLFDQIQEMARFMELGHLPAGGSLQDQSAQALQYWSIYTNALAAAKAEKMKSMKGK